MKLKQNKKLTATVAVVLSLVIVAAGTFAWITSRDKRLNHFETASSFTGKLSVSEVFTPPTAWQPGQTVNKDVVIINTGDTTMSVRVSFEEILKVLGNGGVALYDTTMPTYNTTGTYAAGTIADTDKIPAATNIADYTVANGWNPVANVNVGGLGALPAGSVVLVKQDGTTFGAKAYVPVTFDGKTVNQAIDIGDFTMSESGGAGTGYDTITITGVDNSGTREIQYPYYNGYTKTEADWAGDNVYVTSGTTVVNPTAANADEAQLSSKLSFIFDNLEATPTANKWYYNANDGYFYFCKAVTPGASTAKLLDGVTLASDAGVALANMKFDLGVIADGIQNTTEALTATSGGGWGLNATTDSALIALLLA